MLLPVAGDETTPKWPTGDGRARYDSLWTPELEVVLNCLSCLRGKPGRTIMWRMVTTYDTRFRCILRIMASLNSSPPLALIPSRR